MKSLITILFLTVFVFSFTAQNLVPNPSFEDYSSCPGAFGLQIQKAIGWNTFSESPDFFHTCATIPEWQVPQNLLGYQHPNTGNAYVGGVNYHYNINAREIIGCQLNNSLSISQKYFISLKVNRADSNYFAGYSINNLGVKFFTYWPDTIIPDNFAHFHTNTVLTDTTNWIELFGSFISDSNYQYMGIGNFYDNANTTVINDLNGSYGYYYFDDICVSTDSLTCYNFVGVKEQKEEELVNLYPNPTNQYINIDIANNKPFDISIYNALGQLLLERMQTLHNKIDVSQLNSGLLLVKIVQENNSYTYKILKEE